MTVKSIHYLIDGQTNPINASRIRNVSYNVDASDMTGGFVVRVDEALNFDPDGIETLDQLIAAKFTALLESYPGFANSVFDDLLDATGINAVASAGYRIGERGSLRLNPKVALGSGGILETTTVALGSTPTQAIVTWEAFRVTLANAKTGRATLTYEDRAPSELTVQVSFNNGATYNTVTDGGLYTIAAPDQGSNLRLRIQNGEEHALGLGSWAVVY